MAAIETILRLVKTARRASVVLALMGIALGATAQQYLGTIGGEVTDPSGAKVPAAVLTAEEASTHFKTTATANGAGAFNMPSLQPGTYTLTLTASGFRKEVRTNVVLTAGQLEVIDFQLSPAGATETVNIVAENPLVDTGSANIATTLSTAEVTDLPNNGRNPFVMATLAAGVTNTASGGYFQGKSSQFTNPFSGVAVQVTTEGSGGHNRLMLNGIPDDPAERFSGAGYTGFVPSPEAVQEVKVETSVFDAAVGHGNGVVTNTIIRTGANKVHGAAYYVFQNTYLNANTSEKVPNQNAATGKTPRNNDQLSQTGFVVDGPVWIPKVYNGRDKTFFMVAFERYASHTAINYTSRVPTSAERAGDFSVLCSGGFDSTGLCTSGVQLYDPLSPVDANGNRTAYFANNNIAARLNSAGASLANYLPLPNVTGAAATATNYISTQTSYPSTYPSFIARLDHAIGSKNKLNAIFFRSGLTQNYPLQGFPKGIGPLTSSTGYGYHVYRNNRGGSLDDVQQFSSTMVLESRFGIVFHPFGLTYPGNQNFDLSSINISSSGLPYTSFPGASFSDSYAGLSPGAGGQVSEDTTGSLTEILTKSFSHHTVRFGFDGNLIRYNVQNPQSGLVGTGATNPGFLFDRRFTQKNSISTSVGADASSGDPVASMLLGYFSTANYSINAAYALQQIYVAPWVQDDWRVTPKLTLNLGFRWDYESPFTERYNKMVSNFCTTCANPLQASVSGLTLNGGLQYTSSSNRHPYSPDYNNFQPRIGLAYQAFPGTVFRGGFGIIYFNTLETPIGTGFSQLTSYNNYTTSAPLNSLAAPFPSGVTLPTGSSLGLSTALGQSISFVDPNHIQPRSLQYSGSLQQQMPGNLALQIAYLGTEAQNLEVNHNINVLPQSYYDQGAAEVTYLNTAVANPMAGKFTGTTTLNNATVARNLLLLPYPEFGSVTEQYSSIGTVNYNSLQVQVSRPMRNHFSLQANLTWSKTMLHNGFVNNFGAMPQLYSVQDPNATIVANVFGTLQLPKFQNMNYAARLLVGGWQLNSVFRAQNGNLISAPGSVDIIGDPHQAHPTYSRFINTCYENTSGALVNSTSSAPACDSQSPTPAYRQRLSYTTQHNSLYLPIRQRIYPLMDASLFKQFQLREGVSFEIRGEFFNVLNTPEFGAPSTSLGGSTFGAAPYTTVNGANYFTQANDARIGQLTARINF
ncbi:Carboxypeptidase regulatory-like domain-containing protein [Bryocella elongata]|uniref:Carboxypeptidase regulatory-like domain-containing protein n=1 Tax=Bryocella elongata TaxID=863522 RepID=A0A1H6CAC3_9BACT|nr:carboxypeptidase regulatory-like domain-containing protein [Bryocella elongata]SEG69924.1 Carboxypeptidase regulatory-like domain-containing protein [Bryocella elongata]